MLSVTLRLSISLQYCDIKLLLRKTTLRKTTYVVMFSNKDAGFSQLLKCSQNKF